MSADNFYSEPFIPIPPPVGKILQVVDNEDGSLANIICLSIENTFDRTKDVRTPKRQRTERQDERIQGAPPRQQLVKKQVSFPTLNRPFVISRLPTSIETYSCVDERSFIRAVSKAFQFARSGDERCAIDSPPVSLEAGDIRSGGILTFPLIIILLDSEMRSFIGYWGVSAVRMAARSGCRILIVSIDGSVWGDDVEQHCILVNGKLHIVSNFGTESRTSSDGTRAEL